MPSERRPANRPAHITKGSVLDDLGLSPAELIEANVKVDLWRDLLTHIEPLQLTQKELAKRLGVHQPDVSNLLKGKLSKFSVGTLIHYGAKLDLGFKGRFTEPKRQGGSIRSLRANASQRRSMAEAANPAGGYAAR